MKRGEILSYVFDRGVIYLELTKVNEILKPYLEENDLTLYDVELVKEFGYLILRVSIDSKDGSIDVDTLAKCNEFLSIEIEKYDSDMPEYLLEVCSPGAEKKLRNLDEVKESIGKYIHIEVPGMIYEGNLEDVIEDEIHLRYNAKGRFKLLKVKYEEIKLIRLAVKI